MSAPERPPARKVIPAHAGSTDSGALSTETPQGHPRSRGVNPQDRVRSKMSTGSSPLTRGQLDGLGLFSVIDGVIPAHAGSTHSKPRNPAVAITLAVAADITAHLWAAELP